MTLSPPSFQTIRLETTGKVARLQLSRPEVHNAFGSQMIGELDDACNWLADARGLRVVVLGGDGPSFCAGGDVNWMRESIEWPPEKNRAEALALARMLARLDNLPRPVVARVHGAALGGGMGLLACCDIVVASRHARFGATEVRLGLLPAVISPYVVRKIGFSEARACFLTGHRFDADEARRIGLVHHVVADEAALDERVAEVVEHLLAGGPQAHASCKRLLSFISQAPSMESQQTRTVEMIAHARTSDEGQEGLRAFLEKRPPAWREEPGHGTA